MRGPLHLLLLAVVIDIVVPFAFVHRYVKAGCFMERGVFSSLCSSTRVSHKQSRVNLRRSLGNSLGYFRYCYGGYNRGHNRCHIYTPYSVFNSVSTTSLHVLTPGRGKGKQVGQNRGHNKHHDNHKVHHHHHYHYHQQQQQYSQSIQTTSPTNQDPSQDPFLRHLQDKYPTNLQWQSALSYLTTLPHKHPLSSNKLIKYTNPNPNPNPNPSRNCNGCMPRMFTNATMI